MIALAFSPSFCAKVPSARSADDCIERFLDANARCLRASPCHSCLSGARRRAIRGWGRIPTEALLEEVLHESRVMRAPKRRPS